MSPDSPFATFRRRGTIALLAVALLCPLGMVIWVNATWTFGEELHYWTGNEAKDRMPRMRRADHDDIKFYRYAWQTVGSEYASTRFWTSLMAIVAGLLALASCALPWRGESRFTGWAWLATGLGLLLIGIDERFQGHEWVRVLLLEPAGATPDADWLRHDIELLIYPAGAFIVWLLLYRSLAGDRLARGLLIAVMVLGCLAISTDLLDLDILTKFPNWIAVGMFEELAEFLVGALMSAVAWRRLSLRLDGLPAGPTPA